MEQFNYLYMAAISLPNETTAQKILKSHYMSKSKQLFGFDRESRELKFNPTRTCSRCNSLWSDGGCRVAFKERAKGKCKNKRKCRQLVSKHYKYGMHSGKFTRMSQFMARKLCPQVSLLCQLCGHKQKFYLRPKVRKSSTPALGANQDNNTMARKKKKKNKKRFAGLNEDVMTELKSGPGKSPAVKSSGQNKNERNTYQELAQSLAKNKKRKKGAHKKTPLDSHSISKNKMVQLAQLLKNKDNKSNVNNRMEMMLK